MTLRTWHSCDLWMSNSPWVLDQKWAWNEKKSYMWHRDSSNTSICWAKNTFYQLIVGLYTETKMSSFWWNLRHWLHWKLSKWQFSVHPVTKISSKYDIHHSSLAALKVVKMTIFSAASDENFIKMTTFLFQCIENFENGEFKNAQFIFSIT